MATPNQATFPQVLDAGLVRLAELGERVVYLRQNYQPHPLETRSIIDLRLGLEQMGRATTADEREAISAYLQETYGLLGVYTDPLLRPSLPAIPANGAQARPIVLRIQGNKVLRIQGGKLLGLGYRLVPNTGPPVFNTTLTPANPTSGAVTFTGDAGDSFEFNMPMIASTGGPQQMFLYVAGVAQQAAGIDFPMDAAGEYFRLNYRGVAYLGTFQIVAGTSRVDLLPE